MNRRSTLQIVGVAVAVLLVAFVLGRPKSDGPPLDPESVGDLGTLGLVEFVERSGASVQRGIPADGDDVDVTLVLNDRLNGRSRERLLAWVKNGGHAVITDPSSPLLDTGLRSASAGEELQRGICEIDRLDDVEELSAAVLALLEPVPNSRVCFGDDSAAYVLQFPEGEGTVTGLGGASPFTNSRLDEADNAVLAGRLLLTTEDPKIAVVFSPIAEGLGTRTPTDLIGRNVRWYGWQLIVVTLIGLLWAIRRFGRVVEESDVVELPGSLAVRATAELHRRSATPDRAAATIQNALNARVRAEYRLPPEVDAQLAATVVSEQSGIPIQETALLTGLGASAEVDPVQRMIELDRIARDVFGDNTPVLDQSAASTSSPDFTEETSNV